MELYAGCVRGAEGLRVVAAPAPLRGTQIVC
jgi:hypothetical protein